MKPASKYKTLFAAVSICVLTGLAAACVPKEKPVSATTKAQMEMDASVDNPQWVADRERVVNSPVIEGCQERWDVLWSWAKKGNLQARDSLMGMSMLRMIERPVLNNSAELQDQDWAILAVSSLGYKDNYPGTKSLQKIALERLRYSKSPSVKSFFACVEASPSQKCAQIAVNGKMVPSFEDFAREVDQAVAQGKKPKCRAMRGF